MGSLYACRRPWRGPGRGLTRGRQVCRVRLSSRSTAFTGSLETGVDTLPGHR
ncbi:hypothetical protein vBPaePP1G_003 [Pseudomonas phage vB_PaeP_P1G]|uniref:Uncharacterized protein n=1 Tax=Pseudomonas phage vB_PaeP_P1G TaxID=3025372 RepID=A0AAF0BY95_9CAUD|nr:hypothetical protein vBPaePP1G_003 [Pseudomonas phage vB_PaeP_P1G]